MTYRPLPFEFIFGDPNDWAGIADPANAVRLTTFGLQLASYEKWLEKDPERTPQEEIAIQGLKEVLDDAAVFAIVRAMPDIYLLRRATRSIFRRELSSPADSARGWLLRKLWHHLPTDINTKGNTFEEHLAWEVHVHEIGYLREKHRIVKPDPERLALYLRSWEQLKAEYEKFMAKKAAETEIGGLQGGEAAPAGEKEDTAESGKASETGKIGAPLSWADF